METDIPIVNQIDRNSHQLLNLIETASNLNITTPEVTISYNVVYICTFIVVVLVAVAIFVTSRLYKKHEETAKLMTTNE